MANEKELEERVANLELKLEGKCPECKRVVKNWKPMFGTFAPEWWQTMRERGIDPATGHLFTCKSKTMNDS